MGASGHDAPNERLRGTSGAQATTVANLTPGPHPVKCSGKKTVAGNGANGIAHHGPGSGGPTATDVPIGGPRQAGPIERYSGLASHDSKKPAFESAAIGVEPERSQSNQQFRPNVLNTIRDLFVRRSTAEGVFADCAGGRVSKGHRLAVAKEP
jgi:hypothetical protein